MKINEVAYKWNGALSKRRSTTRIILHHAAASKCTAQQIHSWHKAHPNAFLAALPEGE